MYRASKASEWWSLTSQKRRLVITLFSSVKIFVGAAMWEGFSLSGSWDIHSPSYYFITGFGAALGSGLGHLSSLIVYYPQADQQRLQLELLKAATLALSVFLGPGTIWQRLVNDGADIGWTFTGSFFYMWFFSGFVFFLSFSVFSLLALYIQGKAISWKNVSTLLYHNFSMAISVGAGDAGFMGTCNTSTYADNWLAPAFAVSNDTSVLAAMLLAGGSTAIFFILAQFAQNVTFPVTWADDNFSYDDQLIATFVADSIETNSYGTVDPLPTESEMTPLHVNNVIHPANVSFEHESQFQVGKQWRRWRQSTITTCRMFIMAMCIEGFSLAWGGSEDGWYYVWLALGALFGGSIGHLYMLLFLDEFDWLRQIVHEVVQVSIRAVSLAATTSVTYRVVQYLMDVQWTFTAIFFLTWLVVGSINMFVNYSGYVLLTLCANIEEKHIHARTARRIREFLFATSVGLGFAFLIGEKSNLNGNWLWSIFGISSDTTLAFAAVMLAGSAFATGFLLSEATMNTVLPMAWTDSAIFGCIALW